jgi:branched-chain amino acid transport system permease protein
MSLANLLQLFASGITIGAVYGLVALGYVTIYRCSGVVNFAQGEFVMLGAMLASYLLKTASLPYPLATGVAIVAVGLIGVLTYQLIIVPLGQAFVLMLVMATLGVSMLLQNSALITWGPYPLYLPAFSGDTPIRFGEVAVMSQSLWVLLMAAVVLVALYLLNNHTHFGKSMTATATEPLAANLVGVSTGSMVRWSFAISAVIGAGAGIFVAPIVPINYAVGGLFGLKGFVAAVLGGWGKSTGAVLGGLALGVVETFSAGLLPSGYKDAIAFVVLLFILYYRPSGILGSSLTEAE